MTASFRHPLPFRQRVARSATALDAVAPPTVSPGIVSLRFLKIRSVAAFAFVYLMAASALACGAAMAAWHLAARRGLVADLEELMVDVGFDTFEVLPDVLLKGMLLTAAAAVIVGTFLAVVAATVFNLVNWLTGGIQLTIRQQVSRPAPPTQTTPGDV